MSRKYWSDEVGEAAVFGIFHVELTSEVRDLGDYCTRKIKLSPISKVIHTLQLLSDFMYDTECVHYDYSRRRAALLLSFTLASGLVLSLPSLPSQ